MSPNGTEVEVSFLAETGARLAQAAEPLGFGVGPPAGSGWVRLDEVLVSGLLDRMADDLSASQGRDDVAGSYLGSRIAAPLVASTVAALVVDGRCPDPDPSNVSVHLHHDDGWFDGVRFLEPRAAVVAHDPAAGQPGTVVVADAAALRQWWAEAITAALGPMLEAVRARLPYARRGLWGSVADRIAGVALTAGRRTGRPGAEGWAAATELLDVLGAHAPVRLTRPSPLRVTSPTGREGWFPVRGTCCLYYLTVAGPDPCGEGYCATCPFTDPANRRRKLAAWLDEETQP